MTDEYGMRLVADDKLPGLPAERADRAFFVLHAIRPGGKEWSHEVEFAFYLPNTKANEDFEILFVKWPPDLAGFLEGLWIVIIVPLADAEKVMKLGEKWRLKFRQGLLPVMIGGGEEIQQFPLGARENVWTIEGGYVGSHFSPGGKRT